MRDLHQELTADFRSEPDRSRAGDLPSGDSQRRCIGKVILSLVFFRIDSGKWEEFKIVLFVKPGTFEGFDRDTGPLGEGQGVYGELGDDMLFFACLGLVVKDMEKATAELHEVNVSGEGLLPKRKREALRLQDGEVCGCEVERNLGRQCG